MRILGLRMKGIINFPLSINYFRQRRAGFTLISKACERGFTLIELLVVIVIIGILMGILLVSYQGTRKTARDGKRKADLEQIRSALQLYHADCGQYPPSASVSSGSSLSSNCPGSSVGYMREVPSDPLSGIYKYSYTYNSEHAYTLCACLEGGGITSSCTGACGDCGVSDPVSCNHKVCQP